LRQAAASSRWLGGRAEANASQRVQPWIASPSSPAAAHLHPNSPPAGAPQTTDHIRRRPDVCREASRESEPESLVLLFTLTSTRLLFPLSLDLITPVQWSVENLRPPFASLSPNPSPTLPVTRTGSGVFKLPWPSLHPHHHLTSSPHLVPSVPASLVIRH
jgi:hypothetical protein